MNIGSRMSRNPVTIMAETPAKVASELMSRERVHRLPVLDKAKRLIGLISEKDILLASAAGRDIDALSVADIMTREVLTVDKDTTIESAARLMVDQDISCLPVTEDDRLVGLMTKSDMLKILLELFGARYFGVRISYVLEDKPGALARVSQAIADSDWDIISFGTFSGSDPYTTVCTMKVEGCSKEELTALVSPLVREILDVREV